MNKTLIAQRFSKAAPFYNENAKVQRDVACKLLSLLPEGFCRERVLEIGCGTGLLTKEFLKRFGHTLPTSANIYINDLSEEMESYVKECLCNFIHFLPGDAEHIDFPEEIDLILSSSALQWFEELDAFLLKGHKALKKGGLLAFSTFGPDNFKEVSIALGERSPLPYRPLELLSDAISKHYEIITASQETIETFWSAPQCVLQHMRLTGVTGVGRGTWSRHSQEQFIDNYTKLFSSPKGVTLTYHPIYIIARAL